MVIEDREKYLRIALQVFGAIFILVYFLMRFWPAGWQWIPNQREYEQMILGVYATLGVFLILASKRPLENLSLIWFTVFSSLVHAGIMAVQAIMDSSEHGHLLGDVPALVIVGVVLAALAPRTIRPMKATG
jgi:ABC-type transport system involved in cytochrome c biogenesis permease subunit